MFATCLSIYISGVVIHSLLFWILYQNDKNASSGGITFVGVMFWPIVPVIMLFVGYYCAFMKKEPI